jgi:hypothetical protein
LSFFHDFPETCRWIYPAVADGYYGVTPGIGAAPHRERSALKVYDDLIGHPHPFPETYGYLATNNAPAAYFGKAYAKETSFQDSLVYGGMHTLASFGSITEDGEMKLASPGNFAQETIYSNMMPNRLYGVNIYQLGHVLTTKSKVKMLTLLANFKRYSTLNEVCILHTTSPSKAMLARWNQRCDNDECLANSRRKVKLGTLLAGGLDGSLPTADVNMGESGGVAEAIV